MLLLTGCSGVDVTKIEPLALEEVAGTRLAQMSQEEKDSLIFQYVSDSITVDAENLLVIDKQELTRVNNVLQGVNSMLKGGKNKQADGTQFLSDEYANYLLLEFAKTPYQWQQKSVTPVGYDPASRLYFIDVAYESTNEYKAVVPKSGIAKGETQEDVLKEQRYTDYVAYLTQRNTGNTEKATQLLQNFTLKWGNVTDIMNEQDQQTLLERVQKQNTTGIGAITHTGLISDASLNVGAELTVRYVFKYRYNLGEETDLQVDSLYVKDYELKANKYSQYMGLEKSIEKANKTDEKEEGVIEAENIAVLRPFIDKLILSYHKSIEETNHIGLNKLLSNYETVDKYYSDLNRYSYVTIGGYNYKVLARKGTQVDVLVDRVTQTRARGAEMTLPRYNERYIYTLQMNNDDTLQIKNVTLLERVLTGEPMSVIENVTGVSERIQYSGQSFTKENEEKVTEAIKQFMEVVYEGKTGSSKFTGIVDIGVSSDTLSQMNTLVTSVKDVEKKTNYIVTWNTKTNVYANVTVREVFKKGEKALDTEAVIELANRNGEWKVVNYTRTLSVVTGLSNLNTDKALSINGQ